MLKPGQSYLPAWEGYVKGIYPSAVAHKGYINAVKGAPDGWGNRPVGVMATDCPSNVFAEHCHRLVGLRPSAPQIGSQRLCSWSS